MHDAAEALVIGHEVQDCRCQMYRGDMGLIF
jgi:hypothetical protein